MKTQQAISKAQWISYYANRIFRLYLQLPHPLGISGDYIYQIERDLEALYAEPLKRALIEMTY